jgi:nitroimidazol reductase NimA-like FMN-containing flavoprotein (pyridoxamine 5'-phosphate oxidase superfamily)
MLELTAAEIDELLREQVVGRIGCHADGLTYVVPVIYAYDGECVHVASIEGQKVRLMRANPRVCFEVDEYTAPGRWRSAIAQGTYEESDEEQTARSLALLAERFGGGGERPARRPEPTGRATVCFRIRLDAVTGRAVRR